MEFDKVILDADFCIKIGHSDKYKYLEKLVPLICNEAYIHSAVYEEVRDLIPKAQINHLLEKGILVRCDETILTPDKKNVYHATYHKLAGVIKNPRNPRKNEGETCSLAMAKTLGIPYFITDERELQTIVDMILNTGLADIQCIRIQDIITRIRDGGIDGFSRKEAKVMWRMAGKDTGVFDRILWLIDETRN